MGRRPGEGLCSMSTTHPSPTHDIGWWGQLGLRYTGLNMVSRHEHRVEEAALAVLSAHAPVAFSSSETGESRTFEELAALIATASAEAERVAEQEQDQAAEARRLEGWARVEAAYARPDADTVIVEGRWAGFTTGDAFAWCWTLFQYEPHGFTHPGSQLRHESLQKLGRGELPAVFGYPERARELTTRELDPRQYRRHKEALGAATFTTADVRH